MLKKSGVSVSLEDHLPILLVTQHFHSLPACVCPSSYAFTRAEFLPWALFLQPNRASSALPGYIQCSPFCPVTLFFNLGSLSVVYLEFARLDTSVGREEFGLKFLLHLPPSSNLTLPLSSSLT